ncbi:MAG TPA: potassium/proton antiporter [Phototrophicaceae bacterium]|nr:potassium/proton antiporter [Phototrophicaceae bacterium]
MDQLLVIVAALLLVSIFASKLAVRSGIPALLLFILTGMAIGSEGFGRIEFDNPQITQSIGVLALVVILFSGGLDTHWQGVKAALKEGLLLATVGVAFTAFAVAWLATTFLGFSWAGGILLGATMAATDAAAVFGVLRGKNVNLKGKLQSTLELESGSNDPTAIFLTLAMIELITHPEIRVIDLVPQFIIQMSLGALMGVIFGRVILFAVNNSRLEYDGLYPVLTVSLMLLCFGLTGAVGGNGFLAVYLAGVMVGRGNFIHKSSLRSFHDGLAWLMQIGMFIILGLQVFPSRLLGVAGAGLLVAGFMILVARPLSVFLALAPLKATMNEKLFISWVGLRGAAPIILATFSQLAHIDFPVPIFELVFFVVLVSVLLQGSTVIPLARILNLLAPDIEKSQPLSEMFQEGGFKDYLVEVDVVESSTPRTKRIVDLGLPAGALVVLINRAGGTVIPQGGSVLQPGDQLLIMAAKTQHETIAKLFK